MGIDMSTTSRSYRDRELYLPSDFFQNQQQQCSPDRCYCKGGHHRPNRYYFTHIERNNNNGMERYMDPSIYLNQFMNGLAWPNMKSPADWTTNDYQRFGEVMGEYFARIKGRGQWPWLDVPAAPGLVPPGAQVGSGWPAGYVPPFAGAAGESAMPGRRRARDGGGAYGNKDLESLLEEVLLFRDSMCGTPQERQREQLQASIAKFLWPAIVKQQQEQAMRMMMGMGDPMPGMGGYMPGAPVGQMPGAPLPGMMGQPGAGMPGIPPGLMDQLAERLGAGGGGGRRGGFGRGRPRRNLAWGDDDDDIDFGELRRRRGNRRRRGGFDDDDDWGGLDGDGMYVHSCFVVQSQAHTDAQTASRRPRRPGPGPNRPRPGGGGLGGGGASAGQGLSDLFDQPSRQEAPQRPAEAIASPRPANRVSPQPPRPAPAQPASDPGNDHPLTPIPGPIPDSPPPAMPRPAPPHQQHARWTAHTAQQQWYYPPPGAIPVPSEARFESPGPPGAPPPRFGGQAEESGKRPTRFGGEMPWEREEAGGSPALGGPPSVKK